MLTIHGGRTRRLWPRLLAAVAAARAQQRRCLLLVPEQYTLQAEIDLLSGLHLPGFFDIEVFSLPRFVQRLFQTFSGRNGVRIDANGKNIALAQALLDVQKELRYYGRSAQRHGFIAQSGEWIADMKRAEISPEELSAYAESLPEGAAKEKLSDLARVYDAYSRLLADKFVDSEDALLRAIETLPEARLVQDADVFVYGFDIITDDFSRLLCAITRCCHEAHVYLVMEREEAPDGDCFAPVRDSAERLRGRLRAQGLRRAWIWEENTPLDAPEEVRYLEAALLAPSPAPYAERPQAISLFEAATPYAEAQFIAQQILTLLGGGVQPEEITVLCGDIDAYAPLLDTVFDAYEIPHYLAVKEPLRAHGVVKLLLSALRAVSGGFRREDMLSLLKSGYAPLSEQEIWLLENYTLKYGVSGARWHAPFTRGDEEERRVPEQARAKLSPLLLTLRARLKDAKDGAESLRAPLQFLLSCQVYDTLLRQEAALMQAGMDAQALRARQVWKRLLSLFTQLHEIAGQSRIPGRAMASLLEAGLIDNDISALPPAGGCVSVGAVGNLIPVEPCAVFVCGLNSDDAASGDDGLLTLDEQEALRGKLHVYLGMREGDRDLMAELDVWKALCAPRRALTLSYSLSTQGGAALRPAPVLGHLRRLFPLLSVQGGVSEDANALRPLTPFSALDEIGVRLRSGTLTGEWLDAWRCLLQDERTRPIALSLLNDAQGKAEAQALPPRLATSLFTDRIVSISRLESYAACPYQHFVQYGLRPAQRKEWGVDASERGVFYHAAMEGFTRLVSAQPAWPGVTRDDCDRLMDAALQPLAAQWAESALYDSARGRAESRRYVRLCKRVAWAFTQGARQSRFRPSQNEVAFGYPGGPPPLTLTLSDGERVYVRGRIDRIDRYDSGEGVYLRVIDYKSGAQTLDPARIALGLQLQLLLYLEAALNDEPDALPAGAFYQWMGDPLVDQEKKALIEQELAKRLCLKGVMLSDVQVAEWMDSRRPPLAVEDVFKKDGTPRKGKLVCTLEEMRLLIDQAHRTAVRLTQEIRSGHIDASPVTEGDNSACALCAFAGVCRRDASRAHDRPLPTLTLEELLEKASGKNVIPPKKGLVD